LSIENAGVKRQSTVL